MAKLYIRDAEGNFVRVNSFKGDPGKDGTSVEITNIQQSSEEGGINVVTFSDGKTLTVKNGTDGTNGVSPVKGVDYFDGVDGYTPVAGVDYYTSEEKREFSDYIASELAKREQLKPEFGQSEEWLNANGDTSLLYVLPDGYIYGYIQTVTESETVPNYTNLMDDQNAYIKDGYRYSHSGGTFKEQSSDCAIVVPVPSASSFYIRVRGATLDGCAYVSSVYFGTGNQTFLGTFNGGDVNVFDKGTESNGDIFIHIKQPPSGTWSYVVFHVASGVNVDSLIVTVNEEIIETTTSGGIVYQWASTGHAFIPADYEDRIVAVESQASNNTSRIDALENKPSNGVVTMFISPDGDDANNGLSETAAKKTVQSCVNAGATRISAKRGVYNESLYLLNIKELEIFPTDNAKSYVTGLTRQPIVFDTSDTLAASTLLSYNSIKRVAYNNTANVAYDSVFVSKTLDPVVSASQSSYHAALWLFSDDETTVCHKPKPVLTIAECEAEVNTFCYVDGYIYLNADLDGVTKLVVPTIITAGIYVSGSERLLLREVEVRFSGEYNFDLRECAWVDLYKCSSKFTTRASGFHPVDTDGIFRACYATKCFDGFAPNGHGHTTYIDCVSEYNYDDGMSHHAGTEGTVIGGRYEGNGKGGNIPAYGAKVNIYGGLYKDNKQFGICYAGDGNGNFACGMVQGAVMVDNPVGLEVQTECEVTAMSCVYKDNTTKQTVNGTLTEY